MPSDHPWSDMEVAYAVVLWNKGWSGGDIAAALGARFERRFTRSSVVGRMNRYGGPRRRGSTVNTNKRITKAAKAAAAKPRPAPQRPLPATVVPLRRPSWAPPRPCTLVELEPESCRWPLGAVDPRHPDFRFCGRNHADGSPYCREHTSLARARSDHAG